MTETKITLKVLVAPAKRSKTVVISQEPPHHVTVSGKKVGCLAREGDDILRLLVPLGRRSLETGEFVKSSHRTGSELFSLPDDILVRLVRWLRATTPSVGGVGPLFLSCKEAASRLSRNSPIWPSLGINSDEERRLWVGSPLKRVWNKQTAVVDEERYQCIAQGGDPPLIGLTVAGALRELRPGKTRSGKPRFSVMDDRVADPSRLVKRFFLAGDYCCVLYTEGSLEVATRLARFRPRTTVLLEDSVRDMCPHQQPYFAVLKDDFKTLHIYLAKAREWCCGRH